jgi:hypothetical protein
MHQVSPFALALRFRRGIGDRLSRDGRAKLRRLCRDIKIHS